jgi:hypothetical protein
MTFLVIKSLFEPHCFHKEIAMTRWVASPSAWCEIMWLARTKKKQHDIFVNFFLSSIREVNNNRTVDVFCISKIYDGQNHMFLFWGGLVNYKKTTKHTIVYPDSGPCYDVIAIHPAFLYWRRTVLQRGWAESSKYSLSVREKCSCRPPPEG